MAISHLFPEEGPTLNLNFAGSRTLDPRITFSRSSVGTYMDANGLIVTAAADEPRFDHRYVNGEIESLGLLVEEQRTNLFIRGSTVGDVGTQPTGLYYATTPTGQSAVVSSDFDVDGNGKSIKHTRGESGDNNVGYYTVAGLTTGVTHSFSIYVYIPSSQQSSITFIRFGPDNNYSNIEYGYADTNIVDRWQRVVGKYDPSTQSGGIICRANASGGTYFYTDAWQLEVGAFPTSYIPTSGSTKTRNQDNVSMTGTNFTDWYNPTEGTVFLDCTPVYNNSTNQYRRLLSIHNNSGSQTDVIQFIQTEQSNQVSSAVWDGSSFQTGFGKVVTSGTRHKVAFAVKENNMNASYDGNIGTDDTTCTLPVMTEMDIGSYNTFSSTQTTMHINNISYYPTRLSNSQLISLTR